MSSGSDSRWAHHFFLVGDSMLGQYEYRIVPGHPRANADNAVYLHVLVAEEKLGRYLLPAEVVHHVDENKTNNDPTNLMVFCTKADHTSFHLHNCDLTTITQLSNGSWKSNNVSTRCPECGQYKDGHSKICLSCYKQKARSSIKPEKEELRAILQQTKGHFTNVGKHYGVSDNAVRKWCKSYNLPSHSRDYK